MINPPSKRDAVAVFDLGKTNTKLLVFSPAGDVVFEARTQPVWHMRGAVRVLDDRALEAWIRTHLAAAVVAHAVGHVMISGHGCTFALIRGGELVCPILDYEQEPPAAVAEAIDHQIPEFGETFSPCLPLGLNYGRHLLWVAAARPASLERTEAILAYPQFWSWRLSGKAACEVSYLGCHSHLWAPLKDDFSSLVDRRGWRAKMPGFARAGTSLGACVVDLANGRTEKVIVHNGVHDSNASLYYYMSSGFDDFTLLSTGTWVVIFNPKCPLEALDAERDMLSNVTVDHQSVATARFMGGREFAIASGGCTAEIAAEAVAAAIERGIFALPSFAAGGPFPKQAGRWVGPAPAPRERAAAALLYVALMCDVTLDLVRSDNLILVDGGLLRTKLFGGLLAALRPGQPVLGNLLTDGSALGAAALAFEDIGIQPIRARPQPVTPTQFAGLAQYRDTWRALTEADRRHGQRDRVDGLGQRWRKDCQAHQTPPARRITNPS